MDGDSKRGPIVRGDDDAIEIQPTKKRAFRNSKVFPMDQLPKPLKGKVISFLSLRSRCVLKQCNMFYKSFVTSVPDCGAINEYIRLDYTNKKIIFMVISVYVTFKIPNVIVVLPRRDTKNPLYRSRCSTIKWYLLTKREDIRIIRSNRPPFRFQIPSHLEVFGYAIEHKSPDIDINWLKKTGSKLKELELWPMIDKRGFLTDSVGIRGNPSFVLPNLTSLKLSLSPDGIKKVLRSSIPNLKHLRLAVNMKHRNSHEVVPSISTCLRSLTSIDLEFFNVDDVKALSGSLPINRPFDLLHNLWLTFSHGLNPQTVPLFRYHIFPTLLSYHNLRELRLGIAEHENCYDQILKYGDNYHDIVLTSPALSKRLPYLQQGVSVGTSDLSTPNLLQLVFENIVGLAGDNDKDKPVHCSIVRFISSRPPNIGIVHSICGKESAWLASIDLCKYKDINPVIMKEFVILIRHLGIRYQCPIKHVDNETCEQMKATHQYDTPHARSSSVIHPRSSCSPSTTIDDIDQILSDDSLL